MALITDVQNRIRTQLLVELTNPNDKAATTVDTTFLQRIVDDTEADFEVYGCGVFDATDARYVAQGVIGVLLRLQAYGAKIPQPALALAAWQEGLYERLRMVTGNDRIRPKTSSKLTPSPEQLGSEKVRPLFDGSGGLFEDLLPGDRVRDRFEGDGST